MTMEITSAQSADPAGCARGLLEPELARRAADVVAAVAARLADPARVATIAAASSNREPIHETVMWSPLALSHGYPGVALFFGTLAHQDVAWAAVAHRHLVAAVEAMPSQPSCGLFLGPAAVAAAAQTCGGHRRLRRQLAAWIAEEQLKRIAVHAQRRDSGALGVSWDAYDLINGLSGTGRLLLDALMAEASDLPQVAEAVLATLRHVVRLTEPIVVAGKEVPGWWVPPELEPVPEDRRDYPRGDFNLGMAHGIAGPLALLSCARERGVTVEGDREAAERIGEWLVGWANPRRPGDYWPARAGWDDETAADRPVSMFTRTAWCYGAPGVAAALHRAGLAFEVPAWRSLAVASLRAALSRDEREWRLMGPTICHGYGGLLHAVRRIGIASGDAGLLSEVPRLVTAVLDSFDETAPFGFRHVMRSVKGRHQSRPEHRELDVPGVLEGASGVGCVLLDLVGAQSLGPAGGAGTLAPLAWDRVLMLA